MYLEQEEKSQTGMRGWDISSLMGKKISVVGKQKQSGGPHVGPPPQTLTGSPPAGLGPSLLIPAPQRAPAALEEVSRPGSSSPPREHAGPDLLVALGPVPCPARLLCLSWSSGGSRPGCLPGLLTRRLRAAALPCVRCQAGPRAEAAPTAPAATVHSLQGQGPDSEAPANQLRHRVTLLGVGQPLRQGCRSGPASQMSQSPLS